MSTDRDDLVSIYLEDHRAAAAGGVALARRIAEQYGDDPNFESLVELAAEIREDERALDIIRRGLDADGGYVKRLVAVVGERLGRLKLNGTIVRSSPLSKVIELEALIAAVSGKQRGWNALRAYAGGDELVGVDLADLDDRATRQLDELRRLHARAARIALGGREV